MRLVMIGGVAAGTKAAAKACRMDPELEITIYQAEAETSIGECGLPYLLSGTVERREHLLACTPGEFAGQGIEVRVLHRVEHIDPERKALTVRDLNSGEEFEDTYDRLIIATGAKADLPLIPGVELGGVFTLRFLSDADAIMAYVQEHSPRRAVLIGAGYIGLELAENLAKLGMDVCLVEVADRVLPGFDAEVSKHVERHLWEKGIRTITGQAADSIQGAGRVRAVRVGAEEIPAAMVIAGTGIKPKVNLAKAAGVILGDTGAIRVDSQLRTNLPDVWAAGDCAETTHLVSGEPVWLPLGDTANQMGRVAGINAVGFVAVEYDHPERSMGEISMLAVDPDHQGRGIGTALTGFALERLKDAGMKVAMVETGGDPGHAPARRVYEKAGYTLLPIARYFKYL